MDKGILDTLDSSVQTVTFGLKPTGWCEIGSVQLRLPKLAKYASFVYIK